MADAIWCGEWLSLRRDAKELGVVTVRTNAILMGEVRSSVKYSLCRRNFHVCMTCVVFCRYCLHKHASANCLGNFKLWLLRFHKIFMDCSYQIDDCQWLMIAYHAMHMLLVMGM